MLVRLAEEFGEVQPEHGRQWLTLPQPLFSFLSATVTFAPQSYNNQELLDSQFIVPQGEAANCRHALLQGPNFLKE